MTFKRILLLTFIILISPMIGGLYGIIHDQLTYTISPEYYTKFKFYQFGLLDLGYEKVISNPRLEVSIVGFMSTWWVGMFIAIVLSLFAISIKDNVKMLSTILKAILLTIVIAFIVGLIGLLIGKIILSNLDINWSLPENVIDKKNFIAIGSMHNFSYLGGLIGLIVSVVFIQRQRKKHNEILLIV